MRIGPVPALLPWHRRATGDDEAGLESLGSGEEINRAILSGLIAAEPVRDTARDGAPITVLLVSFSAPDERARDGLTCCEVVVTDSIADGHRRGLRVGRRVWVAGQLTGTGLWATSIGTAPPIEATAI
jgi:hypothetical protein